MPKVTLTWQGLCTRLSQYFPKIGVYSAGSELNSSKDFGPPRAVLSEGAAMKISKTSIRYRLYKSFGIVLSMVLVLFIVNYTDGAARTQCQGSLDAGHVTGRSH